MTRETAERTSRRPWVERVWRGEGSAIAAWTLRALSPLYQAVARAARAAARRSRRRVDGVRVVAIGGLAVGGAGKTTIARWAALEALAMGIRPAIALRGHRSDAARHPAAVVTREAALEPGAPSRFGDEAVAHRDALPPEVVVIAGADRRACAELARESGADLVILDDGWEQRHLAWDALWVALDPLRPFENGWTLPAGPLRRPPSDLSEADAIVLVAETPSETTARLVAAAPNAALLPPVVRFLRLVASWSTLGGVEEPAAPGGAVLLVSSVGSPERLQRFLAGAGVEVAEQIAFPDHGAWDRDLVARRAAARRAGGATALVVSDKDARRAAGLGDVALPIRVVRSRLAPLDDAAPLRAALGTAGASRAAGMAGPAPFR